jgi:flavin-dependent dehydrogenase
MWGKSSASIEDRLAAGLLERVDPVALENGSRVGVIGGGPAGSFFSVFLLKMAETIGLDVDIDIYEPRHFIHQGPAGCNHCGGIVSEFLVQLLAAEGFRLPSEVVQRGIDSYMLHMDVGTVRIDTPLHEKRIAAVYRGNGPRDAVPADVIGFDRHLQDLAVSRGAKIRRQLVNQVSWEEDRPHVQCSTGPSEIYDLVVVAAGINSNVLQRIEGLEFGYRIPETVRTFICEFHLGEETIRKHLGTSMHVFLLDIPHLEFAAIIPKGDFVTLCLLGDEIDDSLVTTFLDAPEVRACFPKEIVPGTVCHCFPRINVKAAVRPFTDRIVLIGDSGVTRLYKDGIGAAYRTAKAAARTAVFHGISDEAFAKHYWPTCRQIDIDNTIGRLMFTVSHAIQKSRLTRRALLRMTAAEQTRAGDQRHMSSVLWDLFTGSAPYRQILLRTFRPAFVAGLGWNLVAGNLAPGSLASANSRPATGDANGH